MFESLPDMAAKRAEISPNRIAFVEGEGGRSWSFAEVNRAANGMAQGLLGQGLQAGDRVAILCPNMAAFFVALFACQKAGLILCPLNWRQPQAELAETLAPFAPSLILHDDSFAPVAAGLAAGLNIPAIALAGAAADWMAQGQPGSAGDIPATRPWYLLFTSGTTGRPKAVIQTGRMAWANAVNIGQAVGLSAVDNTLNFLPLFHTAGINLYALPLFLTGGRSVILPKFDADTVLRQLQSGDISQFFGVPAIYQALSLMPGVDQVDWPGIRCGCGGAPLPEPLIRFFAERGARVLNGFGMTETGPTVFLMDEDKAVSKIGSVGKPQMLVDCRLAGVAEGQPGAGEIQLRGPGITPGYYRNDAATAEAFTDDGWLKTGDVGRRDADGYVYVVDRIKDMYISGGENVYPAEVERILQQHPAVLEAAVIGVPDAKWGEVGAAYVLPRPEQTIEPEALRLFCREHLAAYKVPAHLRLVQDFPRTAAGKIRKPELRKDFDT